MIIVAYGKTNFRSENHTILNKLLVSSSIPKFGRSTPQDYANFGIGTLGFGDNEDALEREEGLAIWLGRIGTPQAGRIGFRKSSEFVF